MFRASLTFVLAVGLLSTLAHDTEAAKVKAWHHQKPGDYDKSKFQRVVVSNTGTLRLARQLSPLASLDATHVWALVEDKAGNLFAGTGDEGKVYKVSTD